MRYGWISVIAFAAVWSAVEAVGVTKETRVTGVKEKGQVSGWSYKTFLSCKPSEFVGVAEQVKCIHWLKEMETVLEPCECYHDQLVKFALRLLKVEALGWWELTYAPLTPETLAKLTWSNFNKKMLEKYSSTRDLDKIEDEFRSLKKGNLPVSHYAKQFLEKLSLVGHVAPDEEAKIKAFVKASLAEIKSAVRITKVATFARSDRRIAKDGRWHCSRPK